MEQNEIMVRTSAPRERQMDRVEQVVRSLPGVVSARAQATDEGDLESIHVLVSDHMPRYRITRAIHSALLIYLDLAIDDHQIEVAVAEEAPPETNGPSAAAGTVAEGADERRQDDRTSDEVRESVPDAGEEPVETAKVNGATAPRDPAGPDAEAPDRPEAPDPTPERERERERETKPRPLAPPIGSGGASTSFADAESTDGSGSAEDVYGSRTDARGETSDAGEPARAETGATADRAVTRGTDHDREAADPARTEERRDDRPSAAPRRDDASTRPPERIGIRPGRILTLRGYGIRSGGRGGVRVRVEVETERGTYRGEVPAPDLDSLSLEIFAEAATIAAERGLTEDFPALRRPGLRVLGIEKTRAVGNVHLAVSVSGYMDDGSRTATGFAAVERDTHRAAALAALDAIERLLREEPDGDGGREPDRGDDPEFDPFGPWSRDS